MTPCTRYLYLNDDIALQRHHAKMICDEIRPKIGAEKRGFFETMMFHSLPHWSRVKSESETFIRSMEEDR